MTGVDQQDLHAALGVWVRDDLKLAESFDAMVPAPLRGMLTGDATRDKAMLDAWASEHTDGLIPRMPLDVTPDLVLALALVHHVAITGNVPLTEFIDWLRSLDCALVIEFPDREDPMVQKLLSGKVEKANPDYERETFERALGERFEVERTERLASRTLYEARPRA